MGILWGFQAAFLECPPTKPAVHANSKVCWRSLVQRLPIASPLQAETCYRRSACCGVPCYTRHATRPPSASHAFRYISDRSMSLDASALFNIRHALRHSRHFTPNRSLKNARGSPVSPFEIIPAYLDTSNFQCVLTQTANLPDSGNTPNTTEYSKS